MVETIFKGERTMRLGNRISLMILSAIILVGSMFGFVGRSAGLSRSLQEEDSSLKLHVWMLENYGTVVNKLLLDAETVMMNVPERVYWAVTARILPDVMMYEEIEYRLSLRKGYDGKIVASVVAPPLGSSIDSQLRSSWRKHPDAPLKKLIGLVRIEQFTITDDEIPKLKEMAKNFERIRLSPVQEVGLILHATNYQVWAEYQWGEKVLVEINGIGTRVKKQDHPLLDWVETFRRTIEDYRKRRSSASQLSR